MAISGKYIPVNYQKYRGDHTNIWYRSLWERRAMVRFDMSSDILEWSNEELVIPYISPVDKRVHRYFPDFVVKIKTGKNTSETVVIEIKPEKQTKRPEQPKRVTKRVLNEIVTWSINEAKWEAAKQFCADRRWHFKIMTEHDLNIK